MIGIGTWRKVALLAVSSMALACAEDEAGGGNTGDQCPEGFQCASGEITADTTWSAGEPVLLQDIVFVTSGTLTIEAGAEIQGDSGSALIITRGARIDAQGTAQAPIVFTSSKTAGERARGDWGGVVLLGAAPVNTGTGQIEGIEASDSRGAYGGSDSAHNCGTIRYARIEFAGFTIGADNELNGLTLGGCGTGTTLDFIQVHMGDDDGVEFFGGTADAKHLVITRAADDSLDWDEGWNGRIQFLVIQQEAGQGDAAFESDNLETNNDATPRSAPTIYNATLIGGNDPAAEQRAMVLRRGTAGEIWDVLMMGFPAEAIDIRDDATVGQIDDGFLSLGALLCFEIGANGETYFADETGEEDDDGGFNEAAWFADENRDSTFGEDPDLADPYNLTAPDFTPAAGSPAAQGVAPLSDGWFDVNADYIGAIEPGATTTWMDGWTAFPAN